MQHDHEWITQLRLCGFDWEQVATWVRDVEDRYTPDAKQLRQAHSRWRRRNSEAVQRIEADLVAGRTLLRNPKEGDSSEFDEASSDVQQAGVVQQEWQKGPDGTKHIVYPYAVDNAADEVREIWSGMMDWLERYNPIRTAPEILIPTAPGILAEIALNDPHFGLLAYGPEVGADQDIRTIATDYGEAVEHLVGVSRIYAPSRYLYLVGNDMAHVNQTGEGGKGAVTKKGTQQDVDTRLSKIFLTMLECSVAGIDRAAAIAPVDVVVVPGNHDPDEAFKLGVALQAWYRSHPHVRIQNSPRKRKYYGYEANAFMLTHGEEVRRRRDSLPLVFATECPDEIWVASGGRGSREIHTGHNHIRLQGGYYPTAEVEENRAIVLRSLPGLCAVDAWHYEEGYQHRRAGSLLTFHPDNGFNSLHEFQPELRRR